MVVRRRVVGGGGLVVAQESLWLPALLALCVVLMGRYGISNWSLTIGNLGYGFILLAACCLASLLVAQ